MKWPSCGVAGCDHPSLYVDEYGVGYCDDCADSALGGIRRACDIDDFDLEWLCDMNTLGLTASRPEGTPSATLGLGPVRENHMSDGVVKLAAARTTFAIDAMETAIGRKVGGDR